MGLGKPLALNILALELAIVTICTSYHSSRNSSGLMLELALYKVHVRTSYMWLRKLRYMYSNETTLWYAYRQINYTYIRAMNGMPDKSSKNTLMHVLPQFTQTH